MIEYYVAPGDLWVSGDHSVLCGDPELGSCEFMADYAGQIALSIVDPPFAAGIHAAARRRQGMGQARDFLKLKSSILATAARARRMLIQIGFNGESDIVERFGPPCGRWEITYSGRSPCALLGYASGGVDWPDFNGLNEKAVPALTVSRLTEIGDVVFDPHVYSGTLALAAKVHERTFVGAGMFPERIGELMRRMGTAELAMSYQEFARSESYASSEG